MRVTPGAFLFAQRRNARAFWSGSARVSAGVLIAGIVAAAYGLLPDRRRAAATEREIAEGECITLSLALVWTFGRETRGRDLRDLESSPARSTSPI